MLFSNIAVLLPDGSVLPHGYVRTEGKTIEWVGREPPPGKQEEVYHGGRNLLMPGFVNTHCHVPMTLLRGYGEGLPLQEWLDRRIFPFEAQLTPEDVYWGALLGIAEMVQNGVTSFTDMYFHCDSIAQAVAESGVCGNLCYGFTCTEDLPLPQQPGFAQAARLFQNWNLAEDGRVRVDMGVHAEYSTKPKAVRGIAEFAKAHQARIHLHLSETRREQEACLARHGKTPARYFADLGVLDSPVTAAHCVWLTEADMELLRGYPVTVSHNPTSNLKLGSGVAPVSKMLEKGIPVALGTDGAASNNRYDMFSELRLALLLQNGLSGEPALLSPLQALRMATVQGANAQGREKTGAIQAGYLADLIVVDFDSPHMAPCHEPLAQLAYAANSSDVLLTMCRGKILYQRGQWSTIDVERVKAECRKAAKRIARLCRA